MILTNKIYASLVYDWKTFIQFSVNDLAGIKNVRSFRFFKDEGKAVMLYKAKSTDETWLGVSGKPSTKWKT